MIKTERYDDVVRWDLSSRRSRLVGYSVSAYLVRGVLIDSGFPAIGAEFRQLIDPRRVRGAFLTHKHEDHAGNAEALAALGVPLGLSPETLRAISDPETVRFYRRWTWGEATPLTSPVTLFTPTDFSLVATPGHSPDHHVVWDNTTDTVFSGDLFLGVKVRIAHPGEHVRQTLESIHRLIAMKPKRLFDGHRGLIPDAVGALTAKADWMAALIAQIERLAGAGNDEASIMRSVMGREAWVGHFSGGDYSRRNFVRSVLTT